MHRHWLHQNRIQADCRLLIAGFFDMLRTSDWPMYYAIAYDIPSNRRRRKVLDKLKNYGLRVQLSVVECELDAARMEKLKQDLLPLINRREDPPAHL
jgi:hypothetical protein